MSIADAIATEDRRAVLVALRDQVAARLDAEPSARDLASLSRRLLDILAALDATEEAPAEESVAERLGRSRRVQAAQAGR